MFVGGPIDRGVYSCRMAQTLQHIFEGMRSLVGWLSADTGESRFPKRRARVVRSDREATAADWACVGRDLRDAMSDAEAAEQGAHGHAG